MKKEIQNPDANYLDAIHYGYTSKSIHSRYAMLDIVNFGRGIRRRRGKRRHGWGCGDRIDDDERAIRQQLSATTGRPSLHVRSPRSPTHARAQKERKQDPVVPKKGSFILLLSAKVSRLSPDHWNRHKRNPIARQNYDPESWRQKTLDQQIWRPGNWLPQRIWTKYDRERWNRRVEGAERRRRIAWPSEKRTTTGREEEQEARRRCRLLLVAQAALLWTAAESPKINKRDLPNRCGSGTLKLRIRRRKSFSLLISYFGEEKRYRKIFP